MICQAGDTSLYFSPLHIPPHRPVSYSNHGCCRRHWLLFQCSLTGHRRRGESNGSPRCIAPVILAARLPYPFLYYLISFYALLLNRCACACVSQPILELRAPMKMEQYRFPRRSASHGTLRSSYSSHGCLGVGPPPIRPLHKPLRSVNENSVLLHSPGALESMLKTTTETGDIGIFTIKSIPPSPLGPRAMISNVGHPHPRPRRSVDNLCRHNPAKRPSSHRDATSDVFSGYGSDSLKSGTSTLSPNSTEDMGLRSYSMTTCGSRHLSHHRSTNTLQSQASGGSHLQRPRSPFPYPTRLKRPGVRPASPAITENGQIDYSRMVEINRISYVGIRIIPSK